MAPQVLSGRKAGGTSRRCVGGLIKVSGYLLPHEPVSDRMCRGDGLMEPGGVNIAAAPADAATEPYDQRVVTGDHARTGWHKK